MATKSQKVKPYNKIGNSQKMLLDLLVFNDSLELYVLSTKDIRILDSLMKYELITDVPDGNDIDSGRVIYDIDNNVYYWDSVNDVVAVDDSRDIGDEIDSNTTDFVKLVEDQQEEIEDLYQQLSDAHIMIEYLKYVVSQRDKAIKAARKALK